MQRFIERERPRVTLWYHQALRIVVKSDGDPKLERLYSAPQRPAARRPCRATTAPRSRGRTTPSPATPRSWSSCPAERCRRPACAGHANAVLALARAVAPPREVAEADPVRRASASADMATTRSATTASTTTACATRA